MKILAVKNFWLYGNIYNGIVVYSMNIRPKAKVRRSLQVISTEPNKHIYNIYARIYIYIYIIYIQTERLAPIIHTGHTEEIVSTVFQYLNMLRETGPQEWIFKECAVSSFLC